MEVLNRDTLEAVSATVPAPAYHRSQLRVGIVHFGVGGFHRAHQAMYLDRLMQDGTARDWAICGVGLLPGDRHMADVLRAQDGLYTLVTKHPDGTLEPRVIGSIARYLYGPADPTAVLDQMVDPAVRIVSLTVTEGGYHVNPVSGELDPTAPELQHDLAHPDEPSSMFGYVLAALRRRRAAGVPPFTVVSCDNIQGNGDVARAMLVAFARLQDPDLGDWIDAEVSFPNSMVDRITPATAAADRTMVATRFGIIDEWPVVAEPFVQWVLEDDFPTGRPPFQDAGVQMVDDVVPYEMMKLRLLNASHQALCYLGYLAGYRYAHEVAVDPLFRSFLLRYMREEGAPTLPPVPGVDLRGYQHQLIERFANAHVRDTLARLCAESSDRIPAWLVPVIGDNLRAGGSVACSALVVAAWARYAEGTDEQGRPIEVVDQRRDRVMAAAGRQRHDDLAFLRDRALFGDLIDDDRFVTTYRSALADLHRDGARAALESLMTEGRVR